MHEKVQGKLQVPEKEQGQPVSYRLPDLFVLEGVGERVIGDDYYIRTWNDIYTQPNMTQIKEMRIINL